MRFLTIGTGLAAHLLLAALVVGPTASAATGPVAARPAAVLMPSYSKDRWMGSNYWTAGGWMRIGRDWQHPGPTQATVRRFVLPEDGNVKVTGRAYKLDTGGGDGVLLTICLDDKQVWTGQLGARDDKDSPGAEHDLALEVRKGQSLRFMVHPKANYTYDSTYWDPLVSYGPDRKYQASAGFSDEQGRSGWFYEVEAPDARAAPLPAAVPRRAFPNVTGMDLPAMVEAEWRYEDRLDAAPKALPGAIEHHLGLTRRLLADLSGSGSDSAGALPDAAAKAFTSELDDIAKAAADPDGRDDKLYLRLRWLKRRIALANPLMGFERLLLAKRVPTAYSHLVGQYFGWRAQPGGGIFILDKPGQSLAARDILGGKLKTGSVLEPQISYDGNQIVFSYVELADPMATDPGGPGGEDRRFFHIYTVNVDGTGLRQVTRGPYDDLMPTWLPDGGIAFSSTRRQGYARCFGPAFGQRWHVYTLHRVEPDGSRLRTLSFHDTNEWFPSVADDGRILYARWDYIDRDAVTHQNLWLTRPDGTNPMALWGNATTRPHCSFQAKAVPDSHKIVFIASAHHSMTAGSVVLLDPDIHDNSQEALRRLTPEVPFPEAESRGIPEYYCSPWPLSERYFLVSYSPMPLIYEPRPNTANALGLYLLDAFGNRELIYRDPAIGCVSAMPLTPRRRPPALPSELQPDAPPVGTMALADVYQGLGDVPRGTIKQLRIVQVLPKTSPWSNSPRIGCGGEENARAILGTVPVEADGSAHFEVPAGKPILLQALDKDGLAYQTMRSVTYVQPGEQVSCAGCHERRLRVASQADALAIRRPASRIEPGPLGGAPFSFVRFVQPVLDRYCINCHGGADKTEKGIDLTSGLAGGRGPFTKSYASLTASPSRVPRYPARNQIQVTEPGGKIGARGSDLMKILRAEHYKVALPDADLRALAAWIDMNAVFYGSYDAEENQRELRGEPIPMPSVQ